MLVTEILVLTTMLQVKVKFKHRRKHKHKHKDVHTSDIRMHSASHLGNILVPTATRFKM